MSRFRQRSVARGGTIAAMAILCAGSARVDGSAQDARDGAGTELRTIRVAAEASGGTTVILVADGPLPEPLTGAVDGPPRIYLDLKGVRPGPVVRLGESDALVRRTRVALHSENPVSSRVVIDLYKPSPYRIDSSGRAEGRLIVVLGVAPAGAGGARAGAGVAPAGAGGAPAGAGVAPAGAGGAPAGAGVAPAAGASGAPASSASSGQSRARTKPPAPALLSTPVPASPATPQRRASGADAYVAQVSVAVGRLQTLRPVLTSIDRRAEQPAGDLAAAATEFDAVARILAAIRVPASRETVHGLLVRACDLGARASRMRQNPVGAGDSNSGWNAASAAAGALIMLDRASIELGSSAPK